MNRIRIGLLCCCLLGAPAAGAQEEKINTDRPDQTEGVSVLKKGQFQGEFGMVYNKFPDGPSAVVGRGLLRYGLVKNVEVRLLAEDGKERDRFMEETSGSIYPLAASTKIALLKEHAFLPDISLVAYVKLPFTSRSSEQLPYWSASVIAAFQQKLSDKWEVDYNAGYKQQPYEKGHQWLATLSVQYSLTKKGQVFAEYFADYASGEDPQHNADAGLLYQLNDNFQVDLSAGGTLSADPANRFVAAGFAFRLPGSHKVPVPPVQ